MQEKEQPTNCVNSEIAGSFKDKAKKRIIDGFFSQFDMFEFFFFLLYKMSSLVEIDITPKNCDMTWKSPFNVFPLNLAKLGSSGMSTSKSPLERESVSPKTEKLR